MDKIKAGKPLIDLVTLCVQADRPLMVAGPHGIGKSEILEKAARALGISYICRDLSLMEPSDLVGLPKAKGNTTTFLPPDFLPTGGSGLLVFEELNRAEKYMRAPTLQLLTARTLNDYRLPPGWLPMAAINPSDPDAGYDVAELDPAIRSRFVQVELVPDRPEWLKWARASKIHPGVIAYVEKDTTVFDQPESNPRAWKYVSDLLIATEAVGGSPTILRSGVMGLVGDKRASAFLATLKSGSHAWVSPEQVLGAYPKHRATVRQWLKNGNTDLITQLLFKLKLYLQPVDTYHQVRDDVGQWKNLGLFLTDLPGDLQESVATDFKERGYDVPAGLTVRKGAA